MKETRFINSFSEKKNSHLGKWAILCTKIAHPHNSGSAGRILKFYTMKGANRKMRMILIFFQKIICLGQMDHFGPKNGASS